MAGTVGWLSRSRRMVTGAKRTVAGSTRRTCLRACARCCRQPENIAEAGKRGSPRLRPALEHILLAVGIDPGIPRQPNDHDRARQYNDAEQDYRQHHELPTQS
ncbi:MAG TPA: hypothetical protein VJ914_17775 [Pseudonocardiaceae bacterium]|nr:hypothetical protein [Pseudonocardiaceae bacterium]